MGAMGAWVSAAPATDQGIHIQAENEEENKLAGCGMDSMERVLGGEACHQAQHALCVDQMEKQAADCQEGTAHAAAGIQDQEASASQPLSSAVHPCRGQVLL